MRTKSIVGTAVALLISATFLASCGKPAPSEPASKTEGAATVSGSPIQSGSVQAPEVKPVEQTPSQNAAADAFSNHDVRKCDLLGSGSWACAESYWNMEATYGFNPRACLNLADKKKIADCETAGNLYVENYATSPAQCRKITEPTARTRCSDRASIALARAADVSACETLRTDDMKRSCADDHYLQMAATWTGGALMCRKVSNPSVRTACEQLRSVAVPKQPGLTPGR